MIDIRHTVQTNMQSNQYSSYSHYLSHDKVIDNSINVNTVQSHANAIYVSLYKQGLKFSHQLLIGHSVNEDHCIQRNSGIRSRTEREGCEPHSPRLV